MEEAAATQRDQSTDTESVIIQPDLDPPAMCPDEPDRREPKTNLNQGEIFKALEIIERDSLAIAGSFTSLFASLRFALSEATSTSVDHMQCFGDATARLQESVLDAATKGNRYINSCMRLNEEMKGIDTLATQLLILPPRFLLLARSNRGLCCAVTIVTSSMVHFWIPIPNAWKETRANYWRCWKPRQPRFWTSG
ncbi:hypothetical protein D5086_000921 [Populus alba]|uniref:Uncharacterized protein n=1 Tax=Populus alba TaxID=43335 RepID=A0ACC4CX83_POPAL